MIECNRIISNEYTARHKKPEPSITNILIQDTYIPKENQFALKRCLYSIMQTTPKI